MQWKRNENKFDHKIKWSKKELHTLFRHWASSIELTEYKSTYSFYDCDCVKCSFISVGFFSSLIHPLNTQHTRDISSGLFPSISVSPPPPCVPDHWAVHFTFLNWIFRIGNAHKCSNINTNAADWFDRKHFKPHWTIMMWISPNNNNNFSSCSISIYVL